MLLNVVAALCTLLASSVVAQTSTTFSSSTTTSSSTPTATHTVVVGENGLNFAPREVTNVSVGDIIEFRFLPQNHSVARAAFGIQPCEPYEYNTGLPGFWSGFQPIGVVSPNPPIFHLPINDTEPIFFYCSAPQACLDGMIGVINPNATFTFEQQFAYTQNATIQFSPVEHFPPEVSSSISRTTTATGASTSFASQTTSTSTPTPTTSTPSHIETSKSSSLSVGAIVGIAIGGFALAVLIGALIYMCGRHRTVQEIIKQTSVGPHNSYQPSSPGIGEVKYPNMTTPNSMSDSRFGGNNGYNSAQDGETFRSASPPTDERTGMMSGIVSPNSPGYPGVKYYDSHEMDNGHLQQAGLRPYNPQDYIPAALVPQRQPMDTSGPHELATSAPHSTVPDVRPFSFQPGEDVKN